MRVLCHNCDRQLKPWGHIQVMTADDDAMARYCSWRCLALLARRTARFEAEAPHPGGKP